jgi:hypothetical protein
MVSRPLALVSLAAVMAACAAANPTPPDKTAIYADKLDPSAERAPIEKQSVLSRGTGGAEASPEGANTPPATPNDPAIGGSGSNLLVSGGAPQTGSTGGSASATGGASTGGVAGSGGSARPASPTETSPKPEAASKVAPAPKK